MRGARDFVVAGIPLIVGTLVGILAFTWAFLASGDPLLGFGIGWLPTWFGVNKTVQRGFPEWSHLKRALVTGILAAPWLFVAIALAYGSLGLLD